MGEQTRLAPTFWAPLTQIRVSERGRRGINPQTVEQYRSWLEAGREAPPVRLARTGDAYIVRDGRHRVAAAMAAGHVLIEAVLQRIAEMARRLVARASPPPSLELFGDVAHRAEHLACTEEERVRLPPSPLKGPQHASRRLHPLEFLVVAQKTPKAAGRRGFESLRLHSCLRSVNGKHAPFVRPRCGFNSCRRLSRDPGRRGSRPDAGCVRL